MNSYYRLWFTFHYASTLSTKVSIVNINKIIYIPLCFYFIRSPALPAASPVSNLHSTMLLLYQVSLMAKGKYEYIYIPLCFYFIPVPSLYFPALVIFTFHYASTLSTVPLGSTLHRSNLHSTMLLLYQGRSGSPRPTYPIYIPLCFYFIDVATLYSYLYPPDLHSTMLLLYPGYSHTRQRLPLSFTFHYASTLSR